MARRRIRDRMKQGLKKWSKRTVIAGGSAAVAATGAHHVVKHIKERPQLSTGVKGRVVRPLIRADDAASRSIRNLTAPIIADFNREMRRIDEWSLKEKKGKLTPVEKKEKEKAEDSLVAKINKEMKDSTAGAKQKGKKALEFTKAKAGRGWKFLAWRGRHWIFLSTAEVLSLFAFWRLVQVLKGKEAAKAKIPSTLESFEKWMYPVVGLATFWHPVAATGISAVAIAATSPWLRESLWSVGKKLWRAAPELTRRGQEAVAELEREAQAAGEAGEGRDAGEVD